MTSGRCREVVEGGTMQGQVVGGDERRWKALRRDGTCWILGGRISQMNVVTRSSIAGPMGQRGGGPANEQEMK